MGRIEPTAEEIVTRDARWAEPREPYMRHLLLTKTASAANWTALAEARAATHLTRIEYMERLRAVGGDDD